MNIDIKSALTYVLEFFKTNAGKQWDVLKPQALQYVKGTENRLLNIALESTTGTLSPEFLADKAKEELHILESQAISLGIISSSMTQEVVNNTIQKVLIVIIKALTDKINENANNTNP